MLRPAFKIAVVNSHLRQTISGLYFLKEKTLRISWGHYHMSGKPVKPSNPAVCFSFFTVGKLKGLQSTFIVAEHQLFVRAVLWVTHLASLKGSISILLLGTTYRKSFSYIHRIFFLFILPISNSNIVLHFHISFPFSFPPLLENIIRLH